jgi:hypothetical protein
MAVVLSNIGRIFSPEPIDTWNQETLNKAQRKQDLIERIAYCWNAITGVLVYLTGFNACRYLVGAFYKMPVPTFILPLSVSLIVSVAFLAIGVGLKILAQRYSPEARGCTNDKLKLFANKGCEALTEELGKFTNDPESLKSICEKVNRDNPGAVTLDPKTRNLQTYLKGVESDKIIGLLKRSRESDILIEFMDLKDIRLAHDISLQFANASGVEKIDKVNRQLKALFARVESEKATRMIGGESFFFKKVRPTVYFWEDRAVIIAPPSSEQNKEVEVRHQTIAKIVDNKISFSGLEHLDSQKSVDFQNFVKKFRLGAINLDSAVGNGQ